MHLLSVQGNPIKKLFNGDFDFKGHRFVDNTPLHDAVSCNRFE